ncbi:hypothetical protein B0T24DRAFT_208728, partial [Lasiosphaeria ovina]
SPRHHQATSADLHPQTSTQHLNKRPRQPTLSPTTTASQLQISRQVFAKMAPQILVELPEYYDSDDVPSIDYEYDTDDISSIDSEDERAYERHYGRRHEHNYENTHPMSYYVHRQALEATETQPLLPQTSGEAAAHGLDLESGQMNTTTVVDGFCDWMAMSIDTQETLFIVLICALMLVLFVLLMWFVKLAIDAGIVATAYV